MDLPLSEKTESLIQKHLASGNYDSPQQIVEAALTLFDQQAADWASVKAKIQAGVDDLREGRYVEIRTPEEAKAFKEEILHEIRREREQAG